MKSESHDNSSVPYIEVFICFFECMCSMLLMPGLPSVLCNAVNRYACVLIMQVIFSVVACCFVDVINDCFLNYR